MRKAGPTRVGARLFYATSMIANRVYPATLQIFRKYDNESA